MSTDDVDGEILETTTRRGRGRPKGSGKNLTRAGMGRPKGSQSKVTVALKDMILASVDEIGGKEYFKIQAFENPTAYMTLVGRVLPKDVNIDANVNIDVSKELMLLHQAAKKANDALKN